MTSADANDVPDQFRSWVRGTGGREFEFVTTRSELGHLGETVPDYWFEANGAPPQEGVKIAASQLRSYLPKAADAILRRTTHVRIAKFARVRDGSLNHVGLFYMQPAKTGALGMVGFPPAPHSADRPQFWDRAPSQLRNFVTHIHDGFVEDHWYDNGIAPIKDWMTLEQYASLTGIFENLNGPIQASDANYQGIPIEQAPRPPEMAVVGHNGRDAAYMFDVNNPDGLAWSYGDEYVMQEQGPVVDLIDSIISARTMSNS